MSQFTNRSSRPAPAAHGVSLDELFPECAGDNVHPCVAQSCTSAAGQVEPGDVFVAVDDGVSDGHEQVREAVARGAAAVVCERPVPVFSVGTYVVDDSREALGKLCQALVGDPCDQLCVIGVAGSHGKSTVISLLESIFRHAGLEVGVLSSFKTSDGMSLAPGVSSLPSAAFLASRLASMAAADCRFALVEVSAPMLARRRVAGISFDAVCITGASATELDVHHTVDNYRNTMRRALDPLVDGGVAVLNVDEPTCRRWTGEIPQPTIAYGRNGGAQVTAQILEQNACETTFVLAVGAESAAIRTNIVGEHHVANCLAAAATALSCGIGLEAIARGIQRVVQLPARMQRVDRGQDFPVFVDAARTPAALSGTLRSARQLTSGRVICVLGEEVARDASATSAIESVVRRLADVAIVTDDLAAAADWCEAAGEALTTQIAADRREAIQWAIALAEPGDVVVIAGSNAPTSSSFGSPAESDVDAAEELLEVRSMAPGLRLVA